VLVAKPPYGHRVGRAATLRNLYQKLGDAARRLPGMWRIGLIVASPRLAAETGLPLTSALMTDHGGQKVYAMVGTNR